MTRGQPRDHQKDYSWKAFISIYPSRLMEISLLPGSLPWFSALFNRMNSSLPFDHAAPSFLFVYLCVSPALNRELTSQGQDCLPLPHPQDLSLWLMASMRPSNALLNQTDMCIGEKPSLQVVRSYIWTIWMPYLLPQHKSRCLGKSINLENIGHLEGYVALLSHQLKCHPAFTPLKSPTCVKLNFPLCCCCLVAKSCLTLLWPIDYSSPGSSVHGISQARILGWVAISPNPGIKLASPTLAGGFFTTAPPGKPKLFTKSMEMSAESFLAKMWFPVT